VTLAIWEKKSPKYFKEKKSYRGFSGDAGGNCRNHDFFISQYLSRIKIIYLPGVRRWRQPGKEAVIAGYLEL
jgi:hypothetical protein